MEPASRLPSASPAPPATGLPMSEVAAVSSLQRGDPRPGGLRQRPYLWPDVLHAPPPAANRHADREYAVYHGIEVADDVRIAHATLVRAEPTVRGERIEVDSRAHVERRLLLEHMDRARRWAHLRERTATRSAAHRLERRRRAAARASRPLAPVLLGWARVEAAAATRGARALAWLVRGAVEVPDLLMTSGLHAAAVLTGPLQRRGLREALREPGSLTPQEKSVLLFLTAAAAAVTVVVLNSVFALLFPEHAGTYRALLAGAAIQFVNMFGLPLVIEPVLIAAALLTGPLVAFTGFFAGKMLGAWVLYLAGDTLHDALHARARGRLRRGLDWLQRAADRHGFLVLLLDNMIPFAPDQVMVVLAVSGMRFRTWFLGIGLGSAIRFAGILLAVYLVGPERVGQFFSNPFG